MFESIVSKISNVIRESVRALGAATRDTPWLAPLAILAVFLVLK
jgi:hypothetical protein